MIYKWVSQVVSFPQVSPQNLIHASPLPLTRYIPPPPFYSSRNVIAVTIQHLPQTKQCQYYCTQHNSSLSQSQSHCIFATVNKQTNTKSQSAITALSLFCDYVSTIKSASNVGCSCHIFQLNCGINCKRQFLSCATVAFSERYNFTVCCRPSCDYNVVYSPIPSHAFPLMPYKMYCLKASVT